MSELTTEARQQTPIAEQRIVAGRTVPRLGRGAVLAPLCAGFGERGVGLGRRMWAANAKCRVLRRALRE